jgi:BolA protein
MRDRTFLLEQRLRAALAPADLQIVDDSAAHAGHAGARDGGGHFNVLIVSAAFAGQSLLQRHRLVYRAVGDLMPREIHALSIRALTPDEL